VICLAIKMAEIRLQYVHFMPATLQPGVLYVAEEFGAAAHLCACGCGKKVRTPLGPTEWSLHEGSKGPTLYPSIGNWQLPCQSHYFISNGKIIWAGKWTASQIEEGRLYEVSRREAYYTNQNKNNLNIFLRFWHFLKKLTGKE